jgi:hypothetical protein
MHTQFWFENLKRPGLGCRWRNRLGRCEELVSSGLEQGPVTGSCEHIKGPLGSIIGKEFLEYYSNC